MRAQQISSLCLFALLIGIVRVRATMLGRRGIKAVVFGRTDPTDFLLIPAVLAAVYAVLAVTLRWPIPSGAVRPFWAPSALGWLGVMLSALAVAGLVSTLVDFGSSFRVGIDDRAPDRLVTTGAFALSRNPIYVCFLVFFAGVFLVFPNSVVSVAMVAFAATVHRQVRREEKFLAEHYGAQYDAYCLRVRRYV